MQKLLRSTLLKRAIFGPHLLAFVPLLSLAAFWIGGEVALYSVAVTLPILLALGGYSRIAAEYVTERDALTGLTMRDGIVAWVDAALAQGNRSGHETGVIVLVIDDLNSIEERFGRSMYNTVVRESGQRISDLMRDDDLVARVGEGFAVGLKKISPPETENLLQISRRIQSVFDEPFSDGPTRTYCSISLGIAAECHVKSPGGANLVAGSQRACELAAVSGPGSVRVYSPGLSSIKSSERDLAREISGALETGEIFAWFQPQLSTTGGKISGFEALARWEHPDRGILAPGSFLEDVERAGLSQRLAEVILKQALMAINAWDSAGFSVPTVSVNFSSDELRNPRLPDYVRWELDRHGIEPGRLVIEVLESVVAESNEDVILRTLVALSQIGCRIDLDDFGTGNTCFLNIRRFNVGRIKIDRSLVSRVDSDQEQHRMVSALLAFSEKLGIDALAEGVETKAEVAALDELGCKEIQGYVASRPMPFGETLLWLEDRLPAGLPKLRRVK